jgi:hypothetical protein
MPDEQSINQLIVDPSGFLRVNGKKAPFKIDLQQGVIRWLERDRREPGPVEVSVSIRDLGKLGRQPG